MKTIKTFALLASVCAVVLLVAGCDKTDDAGNTSGTTDPIEEPKPVEESDEDELHLYAKVENASEYSNVVEVLLMGYDGSKFIELACGEWKDGGFTIKLPKILEPNYLHTLINNSGAETTIIDLSLTVTISNKNVKVMSTEFWGIDKDGYVVTCFYPFKIDEKDNVKSVVYTYVDSDVSISGYTEREGVIPVKLDELLLLDIQYVWWKKITAIYSVEWNKGWNVWNYSCFDNIPERVATEKWTTTPISNLKWYGSEDDLWRINTDIKRKQASNH